MSLSKAQQLARLAAGAIYNVAKDFAVKHANSFRGFWQTIKSKFGLTGPEASELAVQGRRGVRAAGGLGSAGIPFDEGQAATAPLNPHVAPPYETPDRLHYHIQLRYRRGEDQSIQNRQVNVFSDQPITNQDLESAALAELQAIQAQRRGSPKFGQPDDELLDWSVDWVVAFRPLP